MKRYAIGALIAVFALALALVGCGPAQSTDKETLKGFWVLEDSEQMGFDAVLNLDEDEEEGLIAELMIADSFLEGTWQADGSKASITFDDDSASELDLDTDIEEASASSAAAEDASASSAAAEDASASSAAADASASSASADASASSASASADTAAASTGKTASIFVVNDKLTLGQADGSRLVFKKGDMDEYFGGGGDGDGNEQVISLDGDGEAMQTVDEVIEDVKPVELADSDNCTITLTGKGTDFTGDPGFRLSVKNKTKKAIYVTSDDEYKVGDKKIEPGLGEVIEAGATTDAFLYFPKDDLGGGVEALKNISGKIIVGDDSSGDELETLEIKID